MGHLLTWDSGTWFHPATVMGAVCRVPAIRLDGAETVGKNENSVHIIAMYPCPGPVVSSGGHC